VNILFLCVANSARSQMAEGLAKAMFDSNANIQSAGSAPSGVVQLYAIEVLQEIGIDISSHYSKSDASLPDEFRKNLGFVITLCAERICPTIQSKVKIHWDIPDPAVVEGSDEERLNAYRRARDLIKAHLEELGKELKITNWAGV